MSTVDTHDDTQPLPRRDPGTTLDALVAELAVAEKWPTPADWCARCGFAPCAVEMEDGADGLCNPDLLEPMSLDSWADRVVWRALLQAGVRYGVPGRRDMVLAIARAAERLA